MPSATKTPNLKLNKWIGNEYVKRADFVEDNQIIDVKYKESADKIADNTNKITANTNKITTVETNINNKIGTLTELTTEKKDNLVNAINEIDKKIDGLDISTSKKSTKVDAIITATGWGGSAVPYTYNLKVAGATATNVIEVISKSDITAEQVSAFMDAIITPAGQSAGNIALKAWGGKPAIDLPVTVIVRGDL